MNRLFDAGLQPERTELAWRRTALSLAVGSLIAMRLLPVQFGDVVWVLAGIAGLVASGAIGILARRRFRTVTTRLLREDDAALMPGAAVLFVLTLFAVAVGAIAVAIVLVAGS